MIAFRKFSALRFLICYSLITGLNRTIKSSAYIGKMTVSDIFTYKLYFYLITDQAPVNSLSWFSKGLKELIEKKYNIALLYWQNLGQ